MICNSSNYIHILHLSNEYRYYRITESVELINKTIITIYNLIGIHKITNDNIYIRYLFKNNNIDDYRYNYIKY